MGEYGAADEISKLADLKERGLISEAEYDQQRKKVLGGPDGDKRHVPTIAVIGIVVVLVALVVGLLEGTSSNPSKHAAGNNTVHLSLASETQAENAAVAWAEKQVGSSTLNGLCLSLVVDAYENAGFNIRAHASISSNTYPIDVWNAHSGGITESGTSQSPPAGALFFWNNKGGRTLTHVAISTGGWNFVSTSDVYNERVTHYETMGQFNQNSWAIPLGWWLPDGSSTPPPTQAAPTTPQPTNSSPGSSTSGGSTAGTSPLQPAVGGSALQPAAGTSSLQPAAGSGALGGSATITKPTSGSAGTQTTPTTPATTPPTSPPPPPATYSETVGGVSHTWTNYTNAGGTEGPSIAAYQTVQIACKVTGFKVADGDTWWYRIAQSPWNNQYFVSADAFYNNGATSGSLHGTPFVDPAVPNC